MGIHIASFRVILKRRESVIITSLANRERGRFPSWMAMVSFLEETDHFQVSVQCGYCGLFPGNNVGGVLQ